MMQSKWLWQNDADDRRGDDHQKKNGQHRHNKGHHEHGGGGSNGGTVEPTFTVLPGLATSDAVQGFELPPDNGLAANAGYILQAVNSVVKWTTLSGGNANEQSMSNFFSPLGNYNNYFIDARAIYNDATGQFIVSSAAVDSSGANQLLLAVSKDSNPNDGFDFHSYQYSDTTGIDQPDIAADGSTLFAVASVNDLQLELVIPDNGQGPSKEIDLGANSDAGIYKQVASQGGGDYALAQNNGTLTLKHISTAGAVDGSSSVDLGNVSSTYDEQYLPTAGETVPLDAGDARVYGLSSVNNGTLWTTFEVTPTSGPDAGTPNVHWVELNVRNPSAIAVIDQGTISGSVIGSGVGTETGSVAVDKTGDAILNFVATGPDLTPTDYFEIKAAGESTFSAPIKWDASAGPYVVPGAGPFGSEVASRWGDYSGAIPDPNDAHGFYISNEIGISPGDYGYASPIAHVMVPTATA